MAEDAIRSTLIRLSESRRTRNVTFTKGMPTKWQPSQFTDPRSKQAFTQEGAWDFVVEALRSGEPIEQIVLDKPPGAIAYVLHLAGVNSRTLYVKLQICGGCVMGRSFHESDFD